MGSDWQARAKAKRDEILDSIPKDWRIDSIPSAKEQKDVTGKYIHQFLSKQEIEITETDAVGIAKKTSSGDWSAVDVTKAFCHRAALAHQLVNCLHETFFDAALKDAQACDDFLKQQGRPIGPLHGVPISLKDQFHVKDVETSMGYVGWIGTFEGSKDDPRNRTFESEMVRELRNLGAVLFCKTSVPHSLMSGETVNNIIGYTWNPKNRNLCSGGSSGGEGALIGLRGSPLGVGTDIGGSIRIPSGFNGLYGIRPTSGRMPYEGMANSMDGQNSVLSVVGPIATSAGSLKLFMKSILSQEPWLYDPMVVDIPWRDDKEASVRALTQSVSNSNRLTFGVVRHDGLATVQPPVARGISMVVEALEKAGHQVIEWKPPSTQRLLDFTYKSWLYDGGHDVFDAFALSGEHMSPQVVFMFGPEPKDESNATQIAANNVEKRKFQKEYIDYWNSTATQTSTGRPVDGLISPLAPQAAARPENYKYYGYTAFVNGLDFTSVVLPVTNADKNVDKWDSGFKPTNDTDKHTFEDYDPEIYDGAHVSVQIVGRRYTEEKMITIAEYVGGLLGK